MRGADGASKHADGRGAPPRGKEPRLGPMSASFAGLMSTRVCRANASGHGVETMQLETQLTRRRSDMPAARSARATADPRRAGDPSWG